MHYTELLRRSVRIAWHNRWLWLLALFAAETGGGGGNFSSRISGNPFSNQTQSGRAAPFNPSLVTDWIQQHAALLIALGAALVVIWILLFLLSCACAPALVRGIQEIDADRPVGLGRAWTMGRERFAEVLRLRLALLLIWIAILVLFGLLVAAGIVLFRSNSPSGVAVVVAFGISLALVSFLLALALGFITPLALRAAALEQQPGWAALRRANRLTVGHPGRVLACWGLMLACQLGFGIGVAVVATVAGIPAALAVFAAVAAGQLALAIVAGALVVVVLGGALLVAGAAFAAFYASFWTLAFVRLENA